MRLFVAIEVSEEMRNRLETFKQELHCSEEERKKVRWVSGQNFHITLKFFGEIGEDRLALLQSALGAAGKAQKKFPLAVKGVGCFPDFKRPRVLWAGVENDLAVLRKLAEAVEHESVSAGFAPGDKSFSAHLTIARFASPPHPAFSQKLERFGDFSFGETVVSKMDLIQSQLRTGGPVYTVLKEFHFDDHNDH